MAATVVLNNGAENSDGALHPHPIPRDLDKVILEVFEEIEDTFSFPLSSQKDARAFVKVVHSKGVPYETLSEEIGEHIQIFSSWRKSLGRMGIGSKVIDRINQPFYDLLYDSDDGADLVEDFTPHHSSERTAASTRGEVEQLQRQQEVETRERNRAAEKHEEVVNGSVGREEPCGGNEKSDEALHNGEHGGKRDDTSDEEKSSDHEVHEQDQEDNSSDADENDYDNVAEMRDERVTNNSSNNSRRSVEELIQDMTDDIINEVIGRDTSFTNGTADVEHEKPKTVQSIEKKQRTARQEFVQQVEVSESHHKIDPTTDSMRHTKVSIQRKEAEQPKHIKKSEFQKMHEKVVAEDKPKTENRRTARAESHVEEQPKNVFLKEPLRKIRSEPLWQQKESKSESHPKPGTYVPRGNKSVHDMINALNQNSTTTPSSNVFSSKPERPKSASSTSSSASDRSISPVEHAAAVRSKHLTSSEKKHNMSVDNKLDEQSIPKHIATSELEHKSETDYELADNNTRYSDQASSKYTTSRNQEGKIFTDDKLNKTKSDTRTSASSVASSSDGEHQHQKQSPAVAADAAQGAGAAPRDFALPPAVLEAEDAADIGDVDENYNSDYDQDNLIDSPVLAGLVKRISAVKNSKRESGKAIAGYVYAFGDKVNNGGGVRIKVSCSRCPWKRLKQGKLFNPDLEMYKLIGVSDMHGALKELLDDVNVSGSDNWFMDQDVDRLVNALQQLSDKFPSKSKNGGAPQEFKNESDC